MNILPHPVITYFDGLIRGKTYPAEILGSRPPKDLILFQAGVIQRILYAFCGLRNIRGVCKDGISANMHVIRIS